MDIPPDTLYFDASEHSEVTDYLTQTDSAH